MTNNEKGALIKAQEALSNSAVLLSNLKATDMFDINEWDFHLKLTLEALAELDAFIEGIPDEPERPDVMEYDNLVELREFMDNAVNHLLNGVKGGE